MRSYLRISVFAVIAMQIAIPDSTVAMAGPRQLALVTLDAETFDSSKTIISAIENAGLRVRHIFPPNKLIGDVSELFLNNIRDMPGVISLQIAATANAPSRGGKPVMDLFEQILIRLSCSTETAGEFNPTVGMVDSLPRAGDQLPLTGLDFPIGGDAIRAAQANPVMTVPQDYLYTSQYLIGRIAVGILLMESTGGSENWTTAAENSAIAGIVAGADLLTRRAEEHDVDVSWVYEIHKGVPTTYEPIQGRPMPEGNRFICGYNWSFQWVREALGNVGYPCLDFSEGWCWQSAFEYATDLRNIYGADWAIEAYVVEAENRLPFHAFEGGLTAYHVDLAEMDACVTKRFQSPVIGLAYWSGVEGFDPDFGEGFAHEVLHCFGATDEYNTNVNGGYGCSGTGDCSLTSGYLHAPNGNCVFCAGGGSNCLMNDFRPFRNPTICQYTLGQIGWRDTDGDGPVDAVDPHYMWSGIGPVAPGEFAPGDVVRIYTMSGEGPVKKILCNEVNVDPSQPYVIWMA
ncbi:MAG: hypothetical protein HZB43_08460 [candidate division Zixibacteria bacterium]|nr:hypothetical protein [candidate division Zixibacteria bacterium]